MTEDIYLWNPRGRVTKVSPDKLKELMGQGYLQPTDDELRRMKSGNLYYSQVYDQGAELVKKRPVKQETLHIEKMGDTLRTEEA